MATRSELVDFEEFCTRVPDGQKADLIDGVIHVASPDSLYHADLGYWLYMLLHRYLKAKGRGGRIFGSRIAFRLDRENAPEPDLAYVSPERAHLLLPTYVAGPPDLAIEIVSRESSTRDYERKRSQYEHFKVREYWIIDPLEQTTTCYRLSRDGKFKEVRARQGIVTSRLVRGFWIRIAWLWQSPLPDEDDALAEILAAAANGA